MCLGLGVRLATFLVALFFVEVAGCAAWEGLMVMVLKLFLLNYTPIGIFAFFGDIAIGVVFDIFSVFHAVTIGAVNT